MDELIDKLKAALGPEIYLRTFGNDLVNIGGVGRELEGRDVTKLRAALAEAGYEETASWIATEGKSWMSNGVRSVSIRIKEKE